jgi:hypothetical protein
MPIPVRVIVVASFISLACWLVVALRLKRIPRPEGYRGGPLRRYPENFPKSPVVMIDRVCAVVFYGALAYWIWTFVTHK